MTKLLTKEKRRHLRQIISECILFGFSTRQSQDYITKKLGQPISDSYYYECRADLLEQATTKVQYHNDKASTIYYGKYIDRIEEAEFARTKLFELLTNNDADPKLQLEIVESLRICSQTLLELYRALPEITDWYNENNDGSNTKKGIPYDGGGFDNEETRIARERRLAADYSEEAKF